LKFLHVCFVWEISEKIKLLKGHQSTVFESSMIQAPSMLLLKKGFLPINNHPNDCLERPCQLPGVLSSPLTLWRLSFDAKLKSHAAQILDKIYNAITSILLEK
jgi:hypothetical protein